MQTLFSWDLKRLNIAGNTKWIHQGQSNTCVMFVLIESRRTGISTDPLTLTRYAVVSDMRFQHFQIDYRYVTDLYLARAIEESSIGI